ncbi:MAG: type II toxin-antitoxin system Phd/YefM family antitoxin [Nitrospirota bacterium]
MARVVSKAQFKPRSLQYFREIEKSGKELIITDRGRPVLKIVPYSVDPREALRPLHGSVVKYDRPLEPVGVEDWESLR